jgi:hypothetical protein
VGLPMQHDSTSKAAVVWRHCNVGTQDKCWATVASILDEFAARSQQLLEEWQAMKNDRITACSVLAAKVRAHGVV